MALRIAVALVTLLLLAPRPAEAFRCGNYLVTPGDAASLMQTRCGDPASVSPRYATDKHGRQIHLGDVWLYNFGPRSFIGIAYVVDGRVTSVEYGGYGW